MMLLAAVLAFSPCQTGPLFVERKLSPSLAEGPYGNANLIVPSPSGTRVVFSAIDSDGGQAILLVAPSDGSSAPLVLTPDSVDSLEQAAWTPDEAFIVFRQDQDEILSVPSDGSAPPTLLSPGYVFDGFYPLHADGYVFYLGALSAVTERRLIRVPEDGSGPAIALTTEKDLEGVVFSADGSRVLVRNDPPFVSDSPLLAVETDGSTPPDRLNLPTTILTGGGYVLSPDGAVAAFRARDRVGSLTRLYSAPGDGSAPATAIAGPEFTVFNLAITPDASRVVFLANLASPRTALYMVPSDGSASPVLLSPLPPTGDVQSGFLSPDGQRAVYCISGGNPADSGLFSVLVDGSSAPVLLRAQGGTTYSITPDSQRVVQKDDGGHIFAGPIDGSAAFLRITEWPAEGLPAYAVTPDSQTLIHLGHETPGLVELFSVPIVPALGGPDALRLSSPIAAGGSVGAFALSSDGGEVFWRGKVSGSTDITRVFRSSPLDPPGPMEVGAPLPTVVHGDVLALATAGGRVAFTAEPEENQKVELFAAPVDGTAPAVRMSPTMLPLGDVSEFTLAASGELVAFTADAEVDEVVELYSAPTDGSLPAVRLNQPLLAGTDVGFYRISPDGSRIAFRANQAAQPGNRLYSVPSGGGTPVALAATQTLDFSFTPDSANVVYRDTQLYRVPADGSAPPTQLSAPSHTVQSFVTGSTRVVYAATVGGNRRIFGTSLAGGAVVELNGPLVAGGNVNPYTLTTDEQWVVYLADAQIDGRFLLHRVAADRSVPPLVINGPMVGGGDVQSFQISPDGEHVVYLADQEDRGFPYLYSVEISGGVPPVRLTTLFAATDSFTISPRGDYVASKTNGSGYLTPIGGGQSFLFDGSGTFGWAEFSDDGGLLFFRTPTAPGLSCVVTGSSRILEVTDTDVLSGAVEGRSVLYVSDHEVSQQFELFSSVPRKIKRAP